MTEQEREAITEVYFTLRALIEELGESRTDIGFHCAEGCSKLVAAFPWLADIERQMENGET
jgi:hypothetical protein